MIEGLKYMRRKRRLNQNALADIIGVSHSCYGAYERGCGPLPKAAEEALVKYLGIAIPVEYGKNAEKINSRLSALDRAGIWPEAVASVKTRYKLGKTYRIPVRSANILIEGVSALHRETVTLIGSYPYVAVFRRKNGMKESYTWQELLCMKVKEERNA